VGDARLGDEMVIQFDEDKLLREKMAFLETLNSRNE